MIPISQSEETQILLRPFNKPEPKVASFFVFVMQVGSSIPRNTDAGCYIHVGLEIGVAPTKAFTGQFMVINFIYTCISQGKIKYAIRSSLQSYYCFRIKWSRC